MMPTVGVHRTIREVGTILRQAREKRGLSQESAAQLAGLSEGWLYKVENGKVDPHFGNLVRLCGVIGLDLTELFSLSQRRATDEAATSKLVTEEDEDTRRRAFLAWVAAAGTGLIDVERLAESAVDHLYLRDAETVTTTLLDQWYEVAPGVLLPPALAHLRGLQRGLPGPPDLENLTGRTALLAGHLLTMVGRPWDARTCYALTESLAGDIGDRDMEVAALVCRSALYDWRRGKDARRSTALVDRAAALMDDFSAPKLQVWVLARRAEERAVAGDVAGFERDMAAAEAALRPGGDAWYGPRDAAELAAVRGAGELILGRLREAAETLSWTLDRMAPSAVNWRAVVRADRERALAAG